MLSGSSTCELAKSLRCPDDSPIGTKIKKTLIPGLAFARKAYPFLGDLVFSSLFLNPDGDSASALDLTSLDATDAYFDKLLYK